MRGAAGEGPASGDARAVDKSDAQGEGEGGHGRFSFLFLAVVWQGSLRQVNGLCALLDARSDIMVFDRRAIVVCCALRVNGPWFLLRQQVIYIIPSVACNLCRAAMLPFLLLPTLNYYNNLTAKVAR